ncbi:recombinase family protein [Nitrosospira briensis]|uniref:recombinase family protein n=1 Tax=Nitrosospira briensis TaxID=35799 RepID=UPI0008DF4DC1|nr:recombinase family protein [Nitrosospira briensis]SFN67640.1 Helix-turn-helix domain of resolvase [Nitrosospira briensis]
MNVKAVQRPALLGYPSSSQTSDTTLPSLGEHEPTTYVQSLQDPIDTSSPSGKLVFHIFSALAEFERGVIRDRTNAGLKSARERGRIGGRQRLLSDRDLQTAKALLRNPAITVAEVAKRPGVSISTLYNHLPAARAESLEEVVS